VVESEGQRARNLPEPARVRTKCAGEREKGCEDEEGEPRTSDKPSDDRLSRGERSRLVEGWVILKYGKVSSVSQTWGEIDEGNGREAQIRVARAGLSKNLWEDFRVENNSWGSNPF